MNSTKMLRIVEKLRGCLRQTAIILRNMQKIRNRFAVQNNLPVVYLQQDFLKKK